MASLAAATAATSLGMSEMLGNPLQFSSPARTTPAQSRASSLKIIVLFFKKNAAVPTKLKPAAVSPATEELIKWYCPDRRIFLLEGLPDRSRCQSTSMENYLESKFASLSFVLIPSQRAHPCPAMLGAAGFIIPEAFNKFGDACGPEAVWFKTGALLLDGNTLNYFGKNIPINLVVAIIAEVVLLGGAEYYRIINALDLEDKLHPGGPFDPLGLAADPAQAALLKVKEIKNGRLAMFAMLGFFIQVYVTGEGPVENLAKHLSVPFGNNLLTVISSSVERVSTL